PLHQRPNRRPSTCTDNQITLPMPRHSPILNNSRTISNHDQRINKPTPRNTLTTRYTPSPPRTKGMGNHLLQLASGLAVQLLIDRFMTHMHSLIAREFPAQPASHLLRGKLHPQPLPHLLFQPRIRRNLRHLRPKPPKR